VDVTTDPTPAPAGKAIGARVVIGGSSTDWFRPTPIYGGVSSGEFGKVLEPGRAEPVPVFVFAGNLLDSNSTLATTRSGMPKFMAEVASHEVGHTFWLGHQGVDDKVNPKQERYRGHGVWTPIMGTAYDRPVSQWSNAE